MLATSTAASRLRLYRSGGHDLDGAGTARQANGRPLGRLAARACRSPGRSRM